MDRHFFEWLLKNKIRESIRLIDEIGISMDGSNEDIIDVKWLRYELVLLMEMAQDCINIMDERK